MANHREMDLNCDMGESFGLYQYGADKEIMPYISSANIACGFHAGDPRVIRKTVELAAEYGVQIGAHVGFPDRLGFGRRFLDVKPEEVYEYTLYQLGALDGFLRASDLSMSHLKLHGALYMMAADRKDIADATVKAVVAFNPKLKIYALPESALALATNEANLAVVNEYFADRPYTDQQVKMFGWTLEEIGTPADISDRVLRILDQSEKKTFFKVDTICVHSDTPGSPAIMKTMREKLEQEGWVIPGRQYSSSLKGTSY